MFADGSGKPREYQIEAMKFAAQNNFNVIFADEQGLGKTIESLGLVSLHREQLLPAVFVVPSTVKRQWMWEIRRICGTGKEYLTQVIQSGKEKAMPGFQIYIVTYDMLKNDDLFMFLPEGYLKTVFLDECQRIKNHLSDRAKACQKLAKITKYHIPMSGTFIKNHAGEAFTVLNMVAPEIFPHYDRFIENDCDSYESGWSRKIGGLKDQEGFHKKTQNIIIRRTKDEVLKELPIKERKFHHVELDVKLNKVYGAALQELDDLFYAEDGNAFEAQSQKIAIIGRLRHITGLSKVDDCVDFAVEHILGTDRKLTIFVHHQDVAQLVHAKLNDWLSDGDYAPALLLHSGLSSDERQNIVDKFKETSARILVASTLAAGEGLNLQFCSDAVMLERQWNPANEVQAEDRFHRFGQENNVSITYMLASGTIDEYFTEIVEHKRAIVAGVLDNETIQWDQQNLMKELTRMLISKGREKWRL